MQSQIIDHIPELFGEDRQTVTNGEVARQTSRGRATQTFHQLIVTHELLVLWALGAFPMELEVNVHPW